MHPNPSFRAAQRNQNLDFVRAREFGILTVNGENTPLISHIPFRLNEEGSAIELHLVRSNPIVRTAKTPIDGVIGVTGPHSYVSPDWYGIDDQVPTWNYVAVHLHGRLEQLEQTELLPLLNRLSDRFEGYLDKAPWKTEKVDEEALQRMLRMIVPFRFHIEDVLGTWKLNQNKDDTVRLAAADQVEANGIGSDLSDLATLMRNPPK